MSQSVFSVYEDTQDRTVPVHYGNREPYPIRSQFVAGGLTWDVAIDIARGRVADTIRRWNEEQDGLGKDPVYPPTPGEFCETQIRESRTGITVSRTMGRNPAWVYRVHMVEIEGEPENGSNSERFHSVVEDGGIVWETDLSWLESSGTEDGVSSTGYGNQLRGTMITDRDSSSTGYQSRDESIYGLRYSRMDIMRAFSDLTLGLQVEGADISEPVFRLWDIQSDILRLLDGTMYLDRSGQLVSDGE